MSTLQDAGLPILRSLRILEEQQKAGTFKRIIGYVADDIEGGATLSEAMSRFPKCFDRLMVGMVAAGETGGVLDLILSRVADFMEKSQKLKARVKGAMVYPVVVLTAAFTMLILLMIFVIPKFESVLKEMLEGQGLPMITQVVLEYSTVDCQGLRLGHSYGRAFRIYFPDPSYQAVPRRAICFRRYQDSFARYGTVDAKSGHYPLDQNT